MENTFQKNKTNKMMNLLMKKNIKKIKKMNLIYYIIQNLQPNNKKINRKLLISIYALKKIKITKKTETKLWQLNIKVKQVRLLIE